MGTLRCSFSESDRTGAMDSQLSLILPVAKHLIKQGPVACQVCYLSLDAPEDLCRRLCAELSAPGRAMKPGAEQVMSGSTECFSVHLEAPTQVGESEATIDGEVHSVFFSDHFEYRLTRVGDGDWELSDCQLLVHATLASSPSLSSVSSCIYERTCRCLQ